MAKAFLKFWALILGAGLFFAFSFTVGIIAGMLLFIELDTRDLTKGEEPYSSFYVLALPPGKNGPPEILPFYRIDPACIEWDCNVRPINTSQYSFLLPHPEGKLHAQEWEEDDVKIITLSPGRQLIEFKTYTEDYSFTHIYIAEENRVEPLRSKVFGPDQAFQAAPLAFIFALGLYGLGRWLRRKCYPDKISVELQYTIQLIILGALVPLFLHIQIPPQFAVSAGTEAAGGYFSNTDIRTFWVYFYLGLAVGCWAASFLRIRRHSYALNATAAISTLLIIFIPFGTANYGYWLLRIRKKDKLLKTSIDISD
jgi:hypothetical protein